MMGIMHMMPGPSSDGEFIHSFIGSGGFKGEKLETSPDG
jgi:hypothetical protein